MRICYLANASSIHTHRWVKYFVDKGHEVHVISFENDRIEGTTVHVLKLPLLVKNATFLLKIASIYRIKALIDSINPDILHAHYLSNYGFFGALCNFHPFMATSWGSDVLSLETESPIIRWAKKFLTVYVIRKADLITVDAQSLVERVVQLGVPPNKVNLISHGVSLNEFDPNRRNIKLREDLKIQSNSKIVISTRRLESVYDIESLVKAIPKVVRSNPGVHFLILGDGTQKRQLQTMANQLQVEKFVDFVGEVQHEKVADFLVNSDIYVSTSLSDSTSVSLLEAMAARLPVIVTDIKGNKEWIKNGVNGFIIPLRDSEALSEKILQLLDDDEMARKLGSASRRIVERRASYEKEMARVEELYTLLKHKGS